MTYITSIGTSVPKHNLSQREVKAFIKNTFKRPEREIERLLPVFDHANISNRQFVVDKDWFTKDHSFQERNRIYLEKSIEHSLAAIDTCLTSEDFLKQSIPYEAIDMIIFVSSTGISTPSIDAHLLNKRNFRNDVVRMPIWGLGCGGGVNGVARGHDWLTAHPKSVVLLVGVEFCGLTFQKNDHKKSNFIGTALFGDGVSATLLIGNESKYLENRKGTSPKVLTSSTWLKKAATDVMGWDITNNGFEVIFAKGIPALVKTFWSEHVSAFLKDMNWDKEELPFYVAHPGGKKVLEAMEEVLNITPERLYYSYETLQNHGNMSSVTVLYILKEWMKERITKGEKSILSALGPGFSSELISLEWA